MGQEINDMSAFIGGAATINAVSSFLGDIKKDFYIEWIKTRYYDNSTSKLMSKMSLFFLKLFDIFAPYIKILFSFELAICLVFLWSDNLRSNINSWVLLLLIFPQIIVAFFVTLIHCMFFKDVIRLKVQGKSPLLLLFLNFIPYFFIHIHKLNHDRESYKKDLEYLFFYDKFEIEKVEISKCMTVEKSSIFLEEVEKASENKE